MSELSSLVDADPSARHDARPPVRPAAWLDPALMVVAATLVVAIGIVLFGTFWGDPVIYLPYARNIASGDFFSYNPGEFSSGSTSPLWAVLLSIPYLAGTGHGGAKVFSLLFTLGAALLHDQRVTR